MEKSKVAIQALKKGHSNWDRVKRDWQGVIKQSEACENTRGGKIENDLKNLISTCVEVDNKCMDIETSFGLKKGLLSDEAILSGSQLTSELVANIKVGPQKATALKPCFNV